MLQTNSGTILKLLLSWQLIVLTIWIYVLLTVVHIATISGKNEKIAVPKFDNPSPPPSLSVDNAFLAFSLNFSRLWVPRFPHCVTELVVSGSQFTVYNITIHTSNYQFNNALFIHWISCITHPGIFNYQKKKFLEFQTKRVISTFMACFNLHIKWE